MTIAHYTTGIWLRSVVLTILILCGNIYIVNREFIEIGFYLQQVIAGLFVLIIFSIPSYLISRLSLVYILKSAFSDSEKLLGWCLFAMVAVFCNPLTFFLIVKKEDLLREITMLWHPYLATLIIILGRYKHFADLIIPTPESN